MWDRTISVAGARALAFLRGRAYALPRDVADLAPDVLRHRLVMTYESLVSGTTAERLNGDELSRSMGSGVEFAGVRDYQAGDDVRRIDWNLSARANTPFVREARIEAALDVWLVADVSGSGDWGTGLCLKRYRAIELAAAGGPLLGRHGNRLGLLMFAAQPLGYVAPGAGTAHLERVVGRLRSQPRSTSRGPTDLSAALRTMARLARRPSLTCSSQTSRCRRNGQFRCACWRADTKSWPRVYSTRASVRCRI